MRVLLIQHLVVLLENKCFRNADGMIDVPLDVLIRDWIDGTTLAGNAFVKMALHIIPDCSIFDIKQALLITKRLTYFMGFIPETKIGIEKAEQLKKKLWKELKTPIQVTSTLSIRFIPRFSASDNSASWKV